MAVVRGGGADVYRGALVVEAELDRDLVEGQGVTEGNELRGVLGRHYTRDPRNTQNVALLNCVGLDQLQGFGLHEDGTRDNGHSLGGGLWAYIDHLGLAGGVDVGESWWGHLLAGLVWREDRGWIPAPYRGTG